MKIISWNVNGLRACAKKGFAEFFRGCGADIFCVQETKMKREQNALDFSGWREYWSSARKAGYSGTAVFTKEEPLSVSYSMGGKYDAEGEPADNEGRVITLEYEKFYLVNVYVPNAKRGLERLPYRMDWQDDFRGFLSALAGRKPVVLCGDLNVAHTELDIKNAAANRRNAGFTDEERGKMTELLESGFTDAFRLLYPDKRGAYTWWSYMGRSRENNIGWRIDYFLVSESLRPNVREAMIFPEITGSDHCPVGLMIDL
ncbi:MAG: exodeoxyribonuclease III [Clostridiales bacterium]|nr:exodeoxyribonuclease III [Clostridiales bacterium]